MAALFLPALAHGGPYTCPTETHQLEFDLSPAELAAAPGAEIGFKYWMYGRLCKASLPGSTKIDVTESYLTSKVSADGYAEVIPGLSVRVIIYRNVWWVQLHNKHTHNNGTVGGAWPSTPRVYASGSADYSLEYGMHYHLRREPGQLKPGTYVVPVAQIKAPTGTHTLSIKIRVPGPTCTIKKPRQTVSLPPAKDSEVTSLSKGELSQPGKNFRIELNCEDVSALTLTLHDNQGGGAADQWGLSADSTASGVALAITSADTGKRVQAGETIILPVSGPAAMYAPEFTANLVKTGNAVQPGLVRASATFTIDYN